MRKPYVSFSKRRSILDHEVAVTSSREHNDLLYWQRHRYFDTP